MGRVIKYWVVLGLVALLATYGGVFLVFEHVDLSFLQFATIVCAPLFQAVVLAWPEQTQRDAAVDMMWSTLRLPLAQPVWTLDALIIGSGVIWWEAHAIGFGAAINVHSTWILVKAVAALAFVIRAMVRTNRRPVVLALQLAAPMLLLFALDPSTSWLAAAFARVRPALAEGGEVVQRLVFYGPLFSVLIAATLRSARRLGEHSPTAGGMLQGSVAAALVVAVAVVLASFNLPTVDQPWLGVATLAASMASTCVLLAAIVLATADASTSA